MLSKGFMLKAAVAAVGALSVVGAAAAATDNLPGRAGAAAHGAALGSAASTAADDARQTARLGLCEAIGRGADAAERGPAAEALARLAGGADRVAGYCADVAASSRGSSGGTGPDALGPAGTGLCRAYLAGVGAAEGGKELAAAFVALAEAAGGTDKIGAYCSTADTAGAAGAPASGGPPSGAAVQPSSPPRHEPAATPSHPVGPRVPPGPGVTRPAPAPTAPPGQDGTGTP